MEAVEFSTSLPKDKKKSSFQAFGMKITTKADVKIGYMKVRQIKKPADHIMAVYQLKTGDQVVQGSASDREHYGDQEIMNALIKASAVNIAIFVSREYGGIPLRGARFELIREVTTEVIDSMQPEQFVLLAPQKAHPAPPKPQ